MKINPKLYAIANGATPFEVQQLPKRKVELFYMNDFEGVKEEYIGKGHFSTWASEDGINYRVFIEQGYYECCKDLYGEKVNEIWTDFWDTTDGISKKFSRFFMMPLCGLSVSGVIVSMFFGNIGTYVAIGILVVALIAMFIINGQTKKKVFAANAEARKLIDDYLGEKKFTELLERQKKYMDDYYDALYPPIEDETEASGEETNENNESKELDVVETTPLEEEKATSEVTEETKSE